MFTCEFPFVSKDPGATRAASDWSMFASGTLPIRTDAGRTGRLNASGEIYVLFIALVYYLTIIFFPLAFAEPCFTMLIPRCILWMR